MGNRLLISTWPRWAAESEIRTRESELVYSGEDIYIYIRIYHVTQQFQFSLSFHQWRKPLLMCEQLYRVLNSSGCFRTRDICVWLQSSVKKIFSDFYFILFYKDKVIKYANHVDPAAKNFHVFETETLTYCHSRTERGRKIR